MPKTRRVRFTFDERSMESLDKLAEQGRLSGDYTEVPVRNPETGEERILMVPKLQPPPNKDTSMPEPRPLPGHPKILIDPGGECVWVRREGEMTVKTRDGVEFKLGMTLITEAGKELPTNPEEFAVEEMKFGPTPVWCVGRKGGGLWTGVACFYASHAGRLRGLLADAEDARDDAQADVDNLKLQIKALESEGRS